MNKLLHVARLCLAAVFSFSSIWALAQADTTSHSVDRMMRSNGKIYVVMAVCITILLVLFLYLIRIDMKVSKKEKTA